MKTIIAAILLATASIPTAAAETLTQTEIDNCLTQMRPTVESSLIDIDMVRAYAKANPDCKNRTPITSGPAHEYRMWSAEQMIYRIADKLVRSRKVCDQAEWIVGQRLSEKCIASVVGAYPIIGKIREVAATDDSVQWGKIVDAVHQFETELEGPLNVLERK